jgi:hypothetical protein
MFDERRIVDSAEGSGHVITFCDLHAFTDENVKFQSGWHLYAFVVTLVSLPKLHLLTSLPDLKHSQTLFFL